MNPQSSLQCSALYFPLSSMSQCWKSPCSSGNTGFLLSEAKSHPPYQHLILVPRSMDGAEETTNNINPDQLATLQL